MVVITSFNCITSVEASHQPSSPGYGASPGLPVVFVLTVSSPGTAPGPVPGTPTFPPPPKSPILASKSKCITP